MIQVFRDGARALCFSLVFAALFAAPASAQVPTFQLTLENSVPLPGIQRKAIRGLRASEKGNVLLALDTVVRVMNAAGVATGHVDLSAARNSRFIASAGFQGETVWVCDAHERIIFFAQSGKLLAMDDVEPLRLIGGLRPARPMVARVLPDRSMIAEALVFVKEAGSADSTLKTMIARFSTQGATLGVLGYRALSEGLLTRRLYDPDGRWELGIEQNPQSVGYSASGRTVAFVTPAITTQERASVKVVTVRTGGDTLYTTSVPIVATRLPKSVVDSVIEEQVSREVSTKELGNVSPAQVLRDKYHARPAPAFYPPVDAVVVSDDGAVLLMMHTRSAKREFILVDAAGNFAGKAVVPATVDITQFDRGQLWGLETMSGQTRIVHFRLTKQQGLLESTEGRPLPKER